MAIFYIGFLEGSQVPGRLESARGVEKVSDSCFSVSGGVDIELNEDHYLIGGVHIEKPSIAYIDVR